MRCIVSQLKLAELPLAHGPRVTLWAGAVEPPGLPRGLLTATRGPTALALPGGGFAGRRERDCSGSRVQCGQRMNEGCPWGELIHAHSFLKSRSAGSSRIYEPHPSLASAAIETPGDMWLGRRGGLGGPAEPGEAKHRRRHRAHEPAAWRGDPARVSELRAPRQTRFRGSRGASPCPR